MVLRMAQLDIPEPDSTCRVLDVQAVATLLGVAQRTIWRLVERDELPGPIHLGPRRRGWRLSTIERWLDDRERESMTVSS